MQEPQVTVENLTLAYGSFVVQRNLDFEVRSGSITAIMGGSGCGKSTLMKTMIGLLEPREGDVYFGDRNFTRASHSQRQQIVRGIGVTYQQGALWSSMTLAENVSLPLEEYTDLEPKEIAEIASLKLSLVGLKGFEEYYPAEISGGMRKRAGLARALALDPDILFFDEPSAGLDPVSSKRLDDLILEVRDTFGATVVLITHELPSLLRIADDAVFLDNEERTMTARGNPHDLLRDPPNENVRRFLTRDGAEVGG